MAVITFVGLPFARREAVVFVASKGLDHGC